MSQDTPASRKAKKAQRDAERHKTGRKPNRETVALPEVAEEQQADWENDFIPLPADDAVPGEGTTRPASQSKKRKHDEVSADSTQQNEDAPVDGEAAAPVKKKRKRRKAKTATNKGAEGVDGGIDDVEQSGRIQNARFIVYIGNLPFSTTDASLQAHFKKLQPFALRHRIDPETKKSKGFAFLEFEKFDQMETCLKLYHRSQFDPAQGQGKKQDRRKIKVELTAGGGGNGEVRKQLIMKKNMRLDEERQRRFETEKREQETRAKKAKRAPQGKKTKIDVEGDEPATSAPEAAAGGMHPSRLAQMKG